MGGAPGKPAWKSWPVRVLQLFMFTWVNPVIDKASKGHPLSQDDADKIMPEEDGTAVLAQRFEKVYQQVKAEHKDVPSHSLLNTTARALLRIYKWDLLAQPIWVLGEMAVRLASPLLLREFLRWLRSYVAGADPPVWKAWSLAVGIGMTGFVMAFVHHRLFWMTFHLGFVMRQQCVGAVQAKVLRLNTAAVTHASEGYGHVVSLISSDVRRFDDIMVFWNFLWAGPLELAMVLLLVSLELGVVPALAGISAMLAVIPIQAAMVRPVSRIRSASAQVSDERVRLSGEVIEGALAMKMLSWELPFARALSKLRAQEAKYIQQMARIRAVNSAMMFAITPVVSFITFACVRALNGELNLASVFYSLALLHLPKSYMVQAFVQGVQAATELHVSLKRIDAFLSVEEPQGESTTSVKETPSSAEMGQPPREDKRTLGQPLREDKRTLGEQTSSTPVDRPAVKQLAKNAGARDNTSVSESGGRGSDLAGSDEVQACIAVDASSGKEAVVPKAGGTKAAYDGIRPVAVADRHHPIGTVALRGADYDWLRPLGHDLKRHHAHNGAELKIKGRNSHDLQAAATMRAHDQQQDMDNQQDAGGQQHVGHQLTLYGVKVQLRPGELLGVCGAVGSGKSSVLAAMLGELQPLLGGVADGGPLTVGNIAYCAQVPWIMSGSIRDNIVFWHPHDAQRYSSVLKCCALDRDIAMLPAGHDTELGERGINLSGGQKARVALARAAYAGADIVLLDDPLSAVDPRVGRILFNHCIGPNGVMQGATRVLVTHQRQILPLCDRVMVLRGGRVMALGTWQELSVLDLPELQVSAAEEQLSVDELATAQPGGHTDPRDTAEDSSLLQGVMPTVGTIPQLSTASVGGASVSSTHGQGAGAPDSEQDAVLKLSGLKMTSTFSSSNQLSSLAASVAGSIAGSSVGAFSNPPSPSTKHQGVKHHLFSEGAGDKEGADEDDAEQPSHNLQTSVVIGNEGAEKEHANKAAGVALPGLHNNQLSLQLSQQDLNASSDLRSPSQDTSRTLPRKQSSVLRHALSGMFVPRSASSRNHSQHLQENEVEIGKARSGSKHVAYDEEKPCNSSPDSSKRKQQPRQPWCGFYKVLGCGRVPESLPEERVPGDGHEVADQLHAAAEIGRLVQSEEQQQGSVSKHVYQQFMSKIGPWCSALILLLMVSGQAVFLTSDWWIALWASSGSDNQNPKWLIGYGCLTLAVVTLSISRATLFFWSAVEAATRVHNAMVRSVFRAPLSFFHTNPAGRILNRFSSDQSMIDDMLPFTVFDVLQLGFMVLSALVMVAIAVPVILPVFLPALMVFVWINRRYLAASRQVKRWEATTRSPVFASMTATLKGLSTIRAYGVQQHFQEAFLDVVTINGAWWRVFLGISRWVGLRVDILSSVILLASALLAVAYRASVKPNLLALGLMNVLQLTVFVQWCIRQVAETENIMTSLERMLVYCKLPQEPPMIEDGAPVPPPDWPRTGALEYRNVTAIYRPGLPPVLHDITFSLKPGQSCGVVGRTGSGKSSLMLTMFRLIPITHGHILLDGMDVATIALDALRKQLAIIPQDPVLFSGTVRSNLDPWNEHQDHELWEVLSSAKLQPAIKAAGGLAARMAEAGGNLSVGQRQLFCLARALLSRAKVLALDEATANVDHATDALIQVTMRESARAAEDDGRVILVIAHRIDTIMDTDHLLVLQGGKLVEQGSPTHLANQPAHVGVFASMVAAAKYRQSSGRP